MDRLTGKYFQRLQDVRHEVLAFVATLTDAEFAYTPGPAFNSVGVLLRHLTGAERYWFGDVLGGQPANRDRPAEFAAGPVDRTHLLQHQADVRSLTEQVMRSLTDTALDEVISCRSGSGREIQVTREWIITHHIEHEYQHYGQMLLLVKLARKLATSSCDGM